MGCRGGTEPAAVPPPPVAHPAVVAAQTYGCDRATPAAACAVFRAQLGDAWRADATSRLAPCAAGERIGQWRYALIAPLYSPVENISADELARMWRGETAPALAMSVETATALATTLGTSRVTTTEGRVAVSPSRWAIVPADELSPQAKVVTVGGHHPLDDAGGPLTIGLCAAGARAKLDMIENIDRDGLTTVAMTGVTAMARYTAALMDRKGTTYPARDVASWFDHTDYVHVSNEVSFVPTCDPKGVRADPFCSRERYIELMEAIHANIVELDGSHLSDYGWKWLTHTIEMYEQRHWQFFGGGRDQVEATRPLLIEHAGTKLAFVGCNMPRSTAHTIRNGPNVGFCDLARLDWQVRDLKRRGYTPIVSIQHEEVYSHDPPDVIVRDFRRLAAAGAAVVFGSQAHWAHPFEVVDGAYVHYGAGNFFFDQSWKDAQDATADRLYFHHGKLLAVGHLFTRLEEAGRPRPMSDRERAGFLRTLETALAKLPKADPWGAQHAVPAPRTIPDSFLVGTEAIQLAVALPAGDAATHPLVIALHGTLHDDSAIAVTLRKSPQIGGAKLARAITDFMIAKYPIDRAQVTIR